MHKYARYCFLFFVFHFYNKLAQTSCRGLCRTSVKSVLSRRLTLYENCNKFSGRDLSSRKTVFGDVSASSIDFKKVEKCVQFLRPHFSFKDCLKFSPSDVQDESLFVHRDNMKFCIRPSL